MIILGIDTQSVAQRLEKPYLVKWLVVTTYLTDNINVIVLIYQLLFALTTSVSDPKNALLKHKCLCTLYTIKKFP